MDVIVNERGKTKMESGRMLSLTFIEIKSEVKIKLKMEIKIDIP